LRGRLGRQASQHRNAGAQNIHGRARGRQSLQHGLERGRQAAQAGELFAVCGQLACVGKLLVHEQVRDLLEFAAGGDFEDVIAAIVQIIAAAPDGTQRGVARDDTRQGDRFLGLWSGSDFIHD